MQPQLHPMPSITSGISRTESKSGISFGDLESCSFVSTFFPVMPGRGAGCAARARASDSGISSPKMPAEQAPTNLRRVIVMLIASSLSVTAKLNRGSESVQRNLPGRCGEGGVVCELADHFARRAIQRTS